MLKKNIAKAMAAATVFTAVAPVAQSFAAVIDSNQEQEIKDLKEKVYDKFNLKYTKNQALLRIAGQQPGNFVHRKVTITTYKLVNGVLTAQQPVDANSYAEFEKEFDKQYSELNNGEKITVGYNSDTNKVRFLEDGTAVNFKAIKYTNVATELAADAQGLNNGVSVVHGQLADGTDYVKVAITDGYITVKNGDAKLDLTKPIFKVVDGYYVDKDGNSIKKYDEKTNVSDVAEVKALGGVVEGYYVDTNTILDTASVDKGAFAIVKESSSAAKEEVKVSDLYEVSTERLTKKGNELRKAIIDADKVPTNPNEDKLQVKIVGTNKAGEEVAQATIKAATTQAALDALNLVDIRVIFEERTNHITEWSPVYEITITEDRGNTFVDVIKHVLNDTPANTVVSAGLDRYETAVEMSKQGWTGNKPLNNGAVVLVSGANDKLVDGLTATPLAATLNNNAGAPVLLTKKDSIPTEVIDEIERLGAKTVYIVGGTSAVSEEVEKTLEKTYKMTVNRIEGEDRYQTSIAVAEEMMNGNKYDDVFVVGGKGEADALSASAVAAMKKSPILLTQAGQLNKDVKHFIDKNVTDNNDNTDVFVVGGTSSVATAVQNELADMKLEVERLSGKGRQETNAKVISRFEKNGALNSEVTGIVFAKSNNAGLVDALAAGALAAKTNSHIVLATEELTESQEDALVKVKGNGVSLITKTVQAGYGVSEKVAKFIKGLR
ncbi:cell wall-binding repeat-containing protein [Romboutsia timonensis]|uniref:cell wall-binding repeat-containing protein n=1 Tax=Romboutsia timonensis TaxID=1776391 RepID=UPI0008D99676|nr:cell wall-binding repeat-containing protein [Romboutsia timonensis]